MLLDTRRQLTDGYAVGRNCFDLGAASNQHSNRRIGKTAADRVV
jgi:hypothetical protein